MPVHAYHAVIQQLKQQKHELATQHLSERRKAKASDSLSSTILANLSCGVLFFNTSGLVRQANAAARKLLGFASPVGLHAADLFLTATLRPESSSSSISGSGSRSSVGQALAPALTGKAAVRGLVLNYFPRDGESHQSCEMTASPVLAEDASLMGTTLVLTDKTDIERIRHDQKMHQEISSELALGLRNSLTTIAGYAQQLSVQPRPGTGAPVGRRHRRTKRRNWTGRLAVFWEALQAASHKFLILKRLQAAIEFAGLRKDEHMKHMKLMAIVTLLLLALAAAAAQSLGDYARARLARTKPRPVPASRHYDNDNLPTNETLSVVGTAARKR